MSSVVLSEFENGVRTLTLNRPERLNAIDAALVAGLRQALREALADPATGAIVLRGAGRAFCSGDDLVDFPEQSSNAAIARRYLEDLQDVTRLIVGGEKPVIGAIHGWAVGGGFEWAIDCDIVLMAAGTRCFFPELGLGFTVTGAATMLLPRIIGLQRARMLLLSGERIDADQALAMGLAWRVMPEAELWPAAQALGERIAGLPARGVRDGKRLTNRYEAAMLEDALRQEIEAVLPAFLDPETQARAAGFKP